MEIVYLTDITGHIGEWLDAEFDNEVPEEIFDLLSKTYRLASELIDVKCKLNKYNSMLKEKHGEEITVQIKDYIEDNGSIRYYYTSAKYGDSDAYDTVEEAYTVADRYLSLSD